jgi:ACS family D-galactonate transporter-like MFS transporter
MTSRWKPWYIVVMLTMFMVLAFADRAVLGFAAVAIMRDLHLSPSEFGTAASASYWLSGVSGIIGGFLINRYPTKWVLTALALIWAASQLPMLWATTLNEVIAARVVLGIGEGPAFAAVLHACFKWFADKDRAVPTSVASEGAAFGIIFASPVVTTIIVNYGWRTGFAVLGALTLVWAVVWMVTGEEGKINLADLPGDRQTRVPYLQLIGDRTFVGNTLAGFAVACGITIFMSWLPPYLLKGLGYSATQAGWLTTLPWIGSVVLVLAGSYASQKLMQGGVGSRHARGLALCGALGLGGLATVAMTYVPPGALQLLLMSIGFGLPTLAWTLSPAIIGEVTPLPQRGAMLGLYVALANTFAGSLAPYFMGVLVEKGATQAQGYATGFVLLGAIQAIFAAAAWLMIRPDLSRAKFAAHDAHDSRDAAVAAATLTA